MDRQPPNTSPEAFLADVFKSPQGRDGKVIRRAARDVERHIGRDVFIAEIHRRGHRAIKNAGQIIIFCNQGPVRILCPRSPQ